jgi:melanoma-associated antigen p97
MKCQNFSKAVELDRALFDDVYYNVTCHHAFTTEECIQLIDLEKAHLMSLDAGEVFVAGRYNSLIPILQEGFEGGFTSYYAVAVLKKDTLSDVHSLHDLRNKKACFAYVGSQAGWTIPIHTVTCKRKIRFIFCKGAKVKIFQLQREGGMAITDCNNHVKTATAYFGPSCAVNSLINKYNPIGDNSDK